ncbi:hypothetical protein ACEN8I_05795 [Polaromonas sp. CT11-55]
MQLISIELSSDVKTATYRFLINHVLAIYRVELLDSGGIRRMMCPAELEALMLDALTRRADAVKVLSSITWDMVDGHGVILPVTF